jgi:hypothetical protein
MGRSLRCHRSCQGWRIYGRRPMRRHRGNEGVSLRHNGPTRASAVCQSGRRLRFPSHRVGHGAFERRRLQRRIERRAHRWTRAGGTLCRRPSKLWRRSGRAAQPSGCRRTRHAWPYRRPPGCRRRQCAATHRTPSIATGRRLERAHRLLPPIVTHASKGTRPRPIPGISFEPVPRRWLQIFCPVPIAKAAFRRPDRGCEKEIWRKGESPFLPAN